MNHRKRDRELNDEIRSHLEMAARDRADRGEDANQARLSARRELGSEALIKEVTRGMWGWLWVERRAQDLRYAFRQLRRQPGFTATAVLTLALGIGANSAIFSVVNSVLLNPLPYPHADRLFWAWGRFKLGDHAGVSPADFIEYRDRNRSFQSFGAYFVLGGMPRNWSMRGEAHQLQGAMVMAGFFEALGQAPVMGRSFTKADEQVTQPQAAILSYHMWQERYGGDPGVVGTTARLDSSPVTIVGVMPASLEFPAKADFWFPTPLLAEGTMNRNHHMLRGIGLLQPGISMAQGQADLDGIAGGLALQFPQSNTGWGLRLERMRDAMVGPARPVLLMLVGAVSLVLLIACVNLANLLLARYGSRQRELAIRTAIGAGRSRLLGQLITENLVLALIAGVAALALAYWGVALVRNFGPRKIPRLDEIRLDGRVLAFTAAVAALTTLLFGLGPAWLAAVRGSSAAMREGSRAGAGRHRHSLGAVLVVGETALSLCLLIAAGLLMESLYHTLHAPPGFSPQGLITTQILLPYATYPDLPSRARFVERFTDAVRALPGVTGVGIVSELPLHNEYNDTFFTIAEHPPRDPRHKEDADFRTTNLGYFQAMHIPLLRGRFFQERELTRPLVALVDEPFAKRYFPDEDPLGKHVILGQPCEIIGIVGGVRAHSLQLPPRPTIYLPFDQNGSDSFHILARSAGDAGSLAGPIRGIAAAQDPDVALSSFLRMEDVVSQSAAVERFDAILLAIFAGLALALAVAGVYGVFSYIVAQQTHEMGVRMALGARPEQMLRLVLGRGALLAGAGAAMGLAAALFLVRIPAGQLYGVGPRDTLTFGGAALVLIAVAVLACAIPARRAMRVDPLVALRYE
jgi:putative ABC transport system permease protein